MDAGGISDFSKYFGNISEKPPFSENISDYFFWGSATVSVAVRGVSRRTSPLFFDILLRRSN
jgi:hypothetical protein